ncbi:MAG TPA: helix-turn-helix domain containing protein [Candidatus Bilophila faecipullorum]|uniref:Helix-turn-helix domain containing protein n=1 Tax=Candidatus Bilophila faecipullorum TaxID=2838482 RepID=A0A9D1QYI4_9BACT|nr:helix-turn-helix domain containing protein [Candidatus Bilophila faecipullorum]
MERHEFDAAYARICEVCGARTQGELAVWIGVSQSSISDARRRSTIPAQWLLTLVTQGGINPAWALTGEGAKYLVPSELPPAPCALLLNRLTGRELEQRLQRVLSTSVTDMLAEVIREMATAPQRSPEC